MGKAWFLGHQYFFRQELMLSEGFGSHPFMQKVGIVGNNLTSVFQGFENLCLVRVEFKGHMTGSGVPILMQNSRPSGLSLPKSLCVMQTNSEK